MNVNRRTKTVLAIIIVIVIAVFAITRWQRSVATKRLLDELPGDDYAKVMDAMTQLHERGSAVTPALLAHLASPRPAARWRAATLLGEVGTRHAWDPLIRALTDDSPDVRAAAALALGKLRAAPAVSDLERLATDAEADLGARIAAAQALGLIGQRDAAGALRRVLSDRLEAQKAFVAGKRKAADDAAAAVKTAEETLAAAETEEDREAARAALETARQGAQDAAEAAREAEKTYPKGAAALAGPVAGPAPPGEEQADAPPPPTDAAWELRIACARALGMIADPESLPALVEAVSVSNEPHAEVRTAAAYAIGDMAQRVTDTDRAEDLVRGLIRALDDQVGDVRAAALHALGFALVTKDYEMQVEHALAKGLQDDFYWSREAARQSMRRLNIVITES